MDPEAVLKAVSDTTYRKLQLHDVLKEGRILEIFPTDEPVEVAKVMSQLENISDSERNILQRVFTGMLEIYKTSANVTQGLAELSTTMNGPSLKIVLQATVRPIIQLNIPPNILTPDITSSEEEKGNQNKILADCYPKLSGVKNKNNAMKVLVALVYFKIKRELIGAATQADTATAFGVNQKCLLEVIHGKKYFGSKQRARGTEEDQLQVKEEEEDKTKRKHSDDEEQNPS